MSLTRRHLFGVLTGAAAFAVAPRLLLPDFSGSFRNLPGASSRRYFVIGQPERRFADLTPETRIVPVLGPDGRTQFYTRVALPACDWRDVRAFYPSLTAAVNGRLVNA